MEYLTTLRPLSEGECIFCQTLTSELKEEHAVPSGLGGNVRIPAASCESCRQVTHAFETTAMRHTLGPGRYRLGIRPRNGETKRRPKVWPAYKRGAEGALPIKVMIPLEKLPFFITMPTYASYQEWDAGIPDGHELHPSDGALLVTEEPERVVKVLTQHSADYFSPQIDHLAFARMLAKIAACYCVKEFGRANFTSTLSPLILGKTATYRRTVTSSVKPSTGLEHGLTINHFEHDLMHKVSPTGNVCVRIDLFKNLEAPSYYVLAGVLGGLVLRFAATAAE